MFEKFTDRARRVVVLAQGEARMLGHNYIGTEHILLGLLAEGEGVAAEALRSLDVSLEAVRRDVEEIIGRGEQSDPPGHIPFTPRAKKVLELSLREGIQLGHDYLGTEHILLGLLREGEGVAAQVLEKLGASLDRVRQRVVELLATEEGPTEGHPPREASAGPIGPRKMDPRCRKCGSALADTAGQQEVDLAGGEGMEVVHATLAYCRACGEVFGILG